MSTEREWKLDELARRYRECLEQEWPDGETDVTGIEERVRRIEQEMLREVTEEMFREQTGKRPGNQATCPACQGLACYRKQSAQELVILFGRVQIERANFHCAACQQGFVRKIEPGVLDRGTPRRACRIWRRHWERETPIRTSRAYCAGLGRRWYWT